MSTVLTLASEFIDRVANPAYGIRVNEDYSLRLATMLATEGFERLLREEASELTDAGTLTPYGWLWFLGWARSKEVTLRGELLLELAEKWSSVFLLIPVIDLATRNAPTFADSWLPALLVKTTQTRDTEELESRDTIGYAENVLLALLQIGTETTLNAASALLYRRWRGQDELVRSFWLHINELDEETREELIRRVGPPEPRF